MAVKDKSEVTVEMEDIEKAEKMDSIKLFKDNNEYKDDVFVSVNGRRFQIQRGREVEVPNFIKAALETSEKQDQHTADMIAAAVAEFENKK